MRMVRTHRGSGTHLENGESLNRHRTLSEDNMGSWDKFNALAEVIEKQLLKGREDARPASREIAEAINDLIDSMIEDKTGAA